MADIATLQKTTKKLLPICLRLPNYQQLSLINSIYQNIRTMTANGFPIDKNDKGIFFEMSMTIRPNEKLKLRLKLATTFPFEYLIMKIKLKGASLENERMDLVIQVIQNLNNQIKKKPSWIYFDGTEDY